LLCNIGVYGGVLLAMATGIARPFIDAHTATAIHVKLCKLPSGAA
jgi:hypothetical protein